MSLVERARASAERAEAEILRAAAHWADLNSQPEAADGGIALPGCERLVQLGGAGTPPVAEFAPAELGAVLAVSEFSGGRLVADALDLRHRLPLLWSRMETGEVKP